MPTERLTSTKTGLVALKTFKPVMVPKFAIDWFRDDSRAHTPEKSMFHTPQKNVKKRP
jgi:hypothetical protein